MRLHPRRRVHAPPAARVGRLCGLATSEQTRPFVLRVVCVTAKAASACAMQTESTRRADALSALMAPHAPRTAVATDTVVPAFARTGLAGASVP